MKSFEATSLNEFKTYRAWGIGTTLTISTMIIVLVDIKIPFHHGGCPDEMVFDMGEKMRC